MITLELTASEIDNLNYQRFYYPDPLVRKRFETVYLKAKGLTTGQIRELTGRDVKTIRAHLHLYKDGGIEALTDWKPYRPKGELDEHLPLIKEEFRQRPPASLKEACERIYQLTSISRSDTRVEVILKRLGFKFRKPGGIPAKADIVEQEEFLKKT